MKPVRWAWVSVLTPAMLVLGGMVPAAAQSLRDPTIPPFGQAAPDGGSVPEQRGLHGPLSVIYVDGQRRLVAGTRTYAEGQMVGGARIERITETEVWLREGREVRKISNFVGVQRRVVPDKPAALPSDCGTRSSKSTKYSRSAQPSENAADCGKHQP